MNKPPTLPKLTIEQIQADIEELLVDPAFPGVVKDRFRGDGSELFRHFFIDWTLTLQAETAKRVRLEILGSTPN